VYANTFVSDETEDFKASSGDFLDLDTAVYVTDNSFSKNQILETEVKIMNGFKWNVIYPVIDNFLDRLMLLTAAIKPMNNNNIFCRYTKVCVY
jgi:hypothetical protein